MSQQDNVIETFKTKAEAVLAVVTEVGRVEDALAYTVNLCEHKEACQLLAAGCEAPLSPAAGDLCDQKQTKIIAAPALDEALYAKMGAMCHEKGIALIDDQLRNHLAGIDIGLTFIDYGIAETGTLVLNSNREAVRLATMISEIHVAMLAKADIRATAFDLESELNEMLGSVPSYTAFISGASRTADIERVLALGVHGPLELHILLLEER